METILLLKNDWQGPPHGLAYVLGILFDFSASVSNLSDFQPAFPQPSPRQRKLSTKAALQQVPGRLRRGTRSEIPTFHCFTGLTQDFAGLMLHILWSDISLVDHEAIRSIRAPRSRHSWASGRRHCAAVRCQGLRSLAMKPSKQISSKFIKHQHKLSVADMEYLRCDVSQFSCCIILREMLQF